MASCRQTDTLPLRFLPLPAPSAMGIIIIIIIISCTRTSATRCSSRPPPAVVIAMRQRHIFVAMDGGRSTHRIRALT
ncbi:hypothetical protein GE21DRAFT_1292582 [Neurospora crassa]|nr:hypothetical protein GE21DRAFT_1292582 [Neurospora crassa]